MRSSSSLRTFSVLSSITKSSASGLILSLTSFSSSLFSSLNIWTGWPCASSSFFGRWISSMEPLNTAACTSQSFCISSTGMPSSTSAFSISAISVTEIPLISSSNLGFISSTPFPLCSSVISSFNTFCLYSRLFIISLMKKPPQSLISIPA